jgi:hypothetical protein
LPSWLAWIAVVSGTLLFLQGFGLGGVIGTYGLVLDLIGFVLFLLFVLLSSAVQLRDQGPARPPALRGRRGSAVPATRSAELDEEEPNAARARPPGSRGRARRGQPRRAAGYPVSGHRGLHAAA